jgi:hypothetical protein
MEIKIGQIGKIVAGEELGNYIKVLDDTENSGGYLILTATDPNFLDGFDNWVENKEAISQYFNEASWLIDWT